MLRAHFIFGSNMVLQRQKTTKIRGKGDPGRPIWADFSGICQEGAVDYMGNWNVTFTNLEYGGPYTIFITDGTTTLKFNDVYVGEVWLCSGQSNMDQRVSRKRFSWCGVLNEFHEIATACFPLIRYYSVCLQFASLPSDNLADESSQYADPNSPPRFGRWNVCTPQTVGDFSAVSYFFAREIHRELGVPVGIINSCYGASTIQAWISTAKLMADERLSFLIDEFKRKCHEFDSGESQKRFPEILKNWQLAISEYDAKRIKPPRSLARRPRAPRDPRNDQHSPSLLFNGMLHPLADLGISGAIWSHGESNQSTAKIYFLLLKALIEDWRNLFPGPITFVIVQLENINARHRKPVDNGNIPLIREAQLKAVSINRVAMVGGIDVSKGGAHSRNKQEIGRRIALSALAFNYGRKIGYSGPIFERMTIRGQKIQLHFKFSEGLHLVGHRKSFAVASDNGVFRWAKAAIERETVVVFHPKIRKPAAVRYAWAENPSSILYNKYNLPASPFRTDVEL